MSSSTRWTLRALVGHRRGRPAGDRSGVRGRRRQRGVGGRHPTYAARDSHQGFARAAGDAAADHGVTGASRTGWARAAGDAARGRTGRTGEQRADLHRLSRRDRAWRPSIVLAARSGSAQLTFLD
jgi:hypothetical protein